MASPPLPVTSAVSTGAWGRPLRPTERRVSEALAWDVAPVLPPPPPPMAAFSRRVPKRRAVTETVIAVLLLSVLAVVFDPASPRPLLSVEVARISTDVASLDDSAPVVVSPASESKLKADLAEALKVEPPADPVAAAAWRYAISEATAGVAELSRGPANRAAAETDLASSLQALLLVRSRQQG